MWVHCMSLVPPQEAIPDILCVSGKVPVQLVVNIRHSWGEAG
jgi:hypothetical protein